MRCERACEYAPEIAPVPEVDALTPASTRDELLDAVAALLVRMGDTAAEDARRVTDCDESRRACVECIDRGRRAGVIR